MSLDPWLFENIAHVGYFRHFITVYLCICVFVFVYLCIWQSRISFLMSWYRWLFKNISMLGISGTFSHAVFVYLRICICVFVYLTVQNIIFDVLGPLAFKKYSIIRVYEVFLAWWQTTNRVNLVQVRLWNSNKVWLLQFLIFSSSNFGSVRTQSCMITLEYQEISHYESVIKKLIKIQEF